MLQISQAQYKISDQQVFRIDDFTLIAGESWAFVGRNGSGKSMLATALSHNLPLLTGRVHNDFKRIARISFEQLQKLVEEEWQRNNTDLLSANEEDTGLTTAEVIEQQQQDSHRCLQLAQQFAIDHLLTRRFKYLSTGETRKVLLCQLLMAEPDLLILDEPFDGLDVASRQQFAQLLAQLAGQGLTLVLVLNRFHDIPDFIQKAGILSECQIIKQGERLTIMQDEVVKQLVNFEQLQHIHLPDADEPPILLAKDIAPIILNKGYVQYNDHVIINGLTWRVNRGEHWQIVGPNGAGKSTLLSLVTGDHPQGYSNDLTLFGRRRGSGETIWEIKRHIGYVSSSLHIDYRVSSTVKNVLISGYFDSIGVYSAVSDKQHKLADQWLALLGLGEQADQPFKSLSWGQQRLVLIARALVKHPVLLILDEPLQGLDSLNRELVKRWIDLLILEGHSQLLFVSHHAEDAPNCITHRLTFVPDGDETYHYHMEMRAHNDK